MNKRQEKDLLFTSEQLKLESLQLVWLSNDEQTMILNPFPKLWKVFHSINYFTSVIECNEYIEKNTIMTLLVCSMAFVESILSQIHNFIHIKVIYIFAEPSETEKSIFENLSIKYKKVS